METRLIGSLTEIYIGGGDSWITESATTVFHNFYKRLILSPGKSVDDYMEVSDSEKQRLEKIRDEWKRPPQAIIDRWNTSCRAGTWQLYSLGELRQVGTYNEETGYFELNGLTDITYEQALEIIKVGHVSVPCYAPFGTQCKCRTNFPIHINGSGVTSNLMVFSNNYMEVLSVEPYVYGDGAHFKASSEPWMIWSAKKLHTIVGRVGLSGVKKDGRPFQEAPKLKYVRLSDARGKTVDLSPNPLLDVSVFEILASDEYTYNATFKLHTDTYAKMTGDIESEVYTTLPDDEKARWLAAFETLTAKTVTFIKAE